MRKITLILVMMAMVIPFMAFGQGCMEASNEEGVSVMGFFQPQFEYLQETDELTFAFNRARIGLVGNIPYDFSYYLFVEYSPAKAENPFLLDAFITYSRLDPYVKISLGQFKSPFSMERNTSCSGLHTIHRSMVVENLAMDRDMGIMFMGDVKKFLSYRLAVMNGSGRNLRDDNKGKNFIGRFILSPFDFLNVGGGFSFGSAAPLVAGADDDTRTRFSGEMEVKHGNFLLQGEYIKGKDVGSYTTGGGCEGPLEVHEGTVERSGLFVQAMFMTPWNIQPVIKYESYDPNLDIENDKRQITTFGFNFFPNEWTRIQVNYRYCAEADYVEFDNDEILVQAQVKIQ